FGVSEANVQLIGSPPDKILIQIPSQNQDKISFSFSNKDPEISLITDKINNMRIDDFQIEKVENEFVLTFDTSLDQQKIDEIKDFLMNSLEVVIKINFSPKRIELATGETKLEFPNQLDIEAVLDEDNIEYLSFTAKEFGAFEFTVNNYGYDKDSMNDKIVSALSKLDYNFVNLQADGSLNTFVASGGIQSAKRLIGSTAQLEFRIRECGDTKPEELDENVWELVKCFDPQYYNEVATGLESKNLTDASPGTNAEIGQPVVNIIFDDDGSDTFYEITDRISRTGDLLAIYLDNEELITPGADKAISGGRAYIYGRDINATRAREIAIQLRSGALPATLTLVQERNVDAVLGSESLSKSLFAGSIGFVLVLLFMMAYYKVPGVVSSLTLIIYVGFVLAIFKIIPVTLTLSGAAALILSIGFAVDANILIAERIKEELLSGRNLLNSISIGFNRAWPSIRDGNVSTIITAIVLFWFGSRFSTSVMQGFALTLGLGVLISMLTSFYVNRILIVIVSRFNIVSNANWYIPVVKKNKNFGD
ncbi:MAG: protein translocase subunit SecD, partial [Chloroflexota bacterium]|nr:protein translocase subunit SecD [Chloroflexota bacterium]